MFNTNVLGAASAAALSLAVIFGPGTASADVVTISATAPTWTNVVGGSNVNTGTANSFPFPNNTVFQVHWGVPAGGDGQSGLGFNPANPPSAPITTDTVFQLGTLTHYNEPINSGSAASSAQLNLATTITGAIPTTQNFSYQFLIDETPNQTPCAFGGNGNPCADMITFQNLTTASAFQINGVNYTILLLGFGNSAGSITNSFISQEGGSNSVGLWATITAPVQQSVPEPASIALLGMGLLGFAAARRRSQS